MEENGRLGSVFYISVFVVAIFVLWGFLFPEHLAEKAGDALSFTTTTFGWFYLFATFLFLVFAFYLAFGPYGKIKLGKDDDDPDYSYFTWLAMLFSAGMGIGLVFWGVAEPMFHYMTPPLAGIEPTSPEAARMSLRYSFFHWGLHPWAIYTIIALSIAYAQFRKGESGLISSTFRPLIGNHVEGPLGKGIDTLAAIATVFGVATSLGLGTLQINGGLSYLFGIPNTTMVQMIIIIVVTILYMISATTGLNRGIRYLSNLNLGLAAALLLFVILSGPTSFIIDALTTTIGGYLGNIIPMSFRLTPFNGGDWVGAWTLFYWAWWIAWAPFVGSFIARVSRGRTIREFVVTVLLVPTLLGALWFSAFGGSAVFFEMFEQQGIADAVSNDVTSALFVTLEQLPIGWFLGILATVLIITFFVTSADSATFVLGMLTSNGVLNPAASTKLIWGVLQSSIAAALLLSGGLNGLQTASIVAALPFAVIMVFMVVSLNRALRTEIKEEKKRERRRIKKLEELLEQSEQ
jgi:glycine betaine transporter